VRYFYWRNSTTALEPILAQKSERRAGRRPAQPKNPPPFDFFFRDFPRRDFLEAEKGVVFRGLRFIFNVYIDTQAIYFFNSREVHFSLSVFNLFLCTFFLFLFSLSFYINIEKNR
jgi:hypothetical protein